MSFYVGPNKARIELPDWDSVVSAASAGVLDETAWVELKETVPPTSVGANLELARDLASLSVDGGLLILGVSDKTKDVVGVVDSEALRDRVIQVASGRANPALFVDTATLINPNDSSRAVLVIIIPASSSAPHMVDERYWGRSAQGKRPLADQEVERLLIERRRREDRLSDDVRQLSDDLDPVPQVSRKHGHLQAILRPIGYVGLGPSEALGPLHPVQLISNALGNFRPQWAPFESIPSYKLNHPDGIMLRSDLSATSSEEYQASLLIDDSGEVQFSFGGGTRQLELMPNSVEVVSPGQLLTTCHSLILLAGYISTELLGFWGEWEIGISLDKLYGIKASHAHTSPFFQGSPYQRSDYYRESRISASKLTDSPAEVCGTLLAPLLRGLGVANAFLPYTDPDQIAQRTSKLG